MLTALTFQYSECNGIDHKFNKENKAAGKGWVISFCKTQNLLVTVPEKCSLGTSTGFNKVQVNNFFFLEFTCSFQEKQLTPIQF
jgi:hypothetical protein